MMKRKPESKIRRNMNDMNGRHVIAGRLLPLRNHTHATPNKHDPSLVGR